MPLSKRSWSISSSVLCLAVLAGGCGGDESPAPQAPVAAAPAGAQSGLDNPTNKADVVAAVRGLLEACKDKWDDKNAFDACHEPMNAFRQNRLEGVEVTALNLLEEQDPKLRWAGLMLLSNFGAYQRRQDKELSTRLLTVLEKEAATSPLDAQLTYLVLDTNESTGLFDRIKELALKQETAFDIKAMVAGWWRDARAYTLVQKLAASTDPKELHAASQGYAMQFKGHEDEACAFWAEHFEAEDRELRNSAIGHLTGGWSGNTTRDTQGSWFVSGGGGGPSSGGDAWCSPKQIDTALGSIAARVKDNTVDDSSYIYGLGAIAKHAKAKPPQRKKAVAALKKIVETKGAQQRSFALSKLGDIDMKAAKAFAKKFAKDEQLKWTVDNLMKRPDKQS